MIDPRLLRAFVTIADTGSFTTAAERLHMTQSTISQQLGRLEEALGHDLIDRTARPARPTETGERLLGYARRILSLQHEAETLLSDPRGTASIRIGVPDDIVTLPMSQVFAAFSARHREIRLDVTTGLSRDLSKRYRSGEFDIIIVKEPTASADHRATFPEAIAWFESRSAPREWRDPIPLVAFPVGGLYREAMFERLERERRRWYIAFTGSSLNSVLVAIESGLGLSVVPTATAAGYKVRPHKGFGMEPAMVVSLYSWEKGGDIGELVELMSRVLSKRYTSPRSA
ncbi:MAG TPA: LysR family transcriptional regulator [Hyphomicrobium sp.]|nr:LysR family transcriptional regulator [Hyphomicrobium sp.]